MNYRRKKLDHCQTFQVIKQNRNGFSSSISVILSYFFISLFFHTSLFHLTYFSPRLFLTKASEKSGTQHDDESSLRLAKSKKMKENFHFPFFSFFLSSRFLSLSTAGGRASKQLLLLTSAQARDDPQRGRGGARGSGWVRRDAGEVKGQACMCHGLL